MKIRKISQISYKELERKLNIIESVGERIGKIFGLIIKSPFRFLVFIFSFMIIATIAFIYSAKSGFNKS